MMMELNWTLDYFTLSLEKLWNIPSGPQVSQIDPTQLLSAHKSLRSKIESGQVGFFRYPKEISHDALSQIRSLSKDFRREFSAAVCLGIGGSHLGPWALLQAFRTQSDTDAFPIFWVSNSDPSAIRRAHHFVKSQEGNKVATILISKSGNTTETLSSFFYLSHFLNPKGFVAITDPSSGELRKLATHYGWHTLPVPPNVGGRYSVLSAVGLFPAAIASIHIDDLLLGAAKCIDYLEDLPPEKNPAYLFALSLHLWDACYNHPIQYLMPYWADLTPFAQWYVQLWAESLGKNKKGPTPVAALGTTDQHSQLQLFKEGPKDKVIGFMNVLDIGHEISVGIPKIEPLQTSYLLNHSFQKMTVLASHATEESLTRSSVPTYRIEMPQLTPAAMGALFVFFETACAFAAELYGVNAFDQPGVEETKSLLHEALSKRR